MNNKYANIPAEQLVAMGDQQYGAYGQVDQELYQQLQMLASSGDPVARAEVERFRPVEKVANPNWTVGMPSGYTADPTRTQTPNQEIPSPTSTPTGGGPDIGQVSASPSYNSGVNADQYRYSPNQAPWQPSPTATATGTPTGGDIGGAPVGAPGNNGMPVGDPRATNDQLAQIIASLDEQMWSSMNGGGVGGGVPTGGQPTGGAPMDTSRIPGMGAPGTPPGGSPGGFQAPPSAAGNKNTLPNPADFNVPGAGADPSFDQLLMQTMDAPWLANQGIGWTGITPGGTFDPNDPNGQMNLILQDLEGQGLPRWMAGQDQPFIQSMNTLAPFMNPNAPTPSNLTLAENTPGMRENIRTPGKYIDPGAYYDAVVGVDPNQLGDYGSPEQQMGLISQGIEALAPFYDPQSLQMVQQRLGAALNEWQRGVSTDPSFAAQYPTAISYLESIGAADWM